MIRFLAFIFTLISLGSFAQTSELQFNANWKFKKVGSNNYYPAKVPGTVHADLLRNKLIKDPFVNENEKSVQWIENEDWEYTGIFNCAPSTLKNKHIELRFEGLDTYAKVYLNGKQILDCNNMFRSWTVDVKPFLKSEKNILKIVFESAVKKGKAEAAKLSYTLPGNEKVFTRKAQYQYGWDWGPRLVTCGIYKPLKLICWNDVKIEAIKHVIEELNDSVAKIKFTTTIKSAVDSHYVLVINAYHGDINNAKLQHRRYYTLKLEKGINVDTFSYTIDYPKLWNSNGLGYPHMYGCDFELRKDHTIKDYKNISIGLRKFELVREKDFFGESFYFKLNGKPVFMKGANYIPQDNFITRTTANNYDSIVEMAKNANMNMLRVWGGGLYADEQFYNACDRAGILVWQDFMFACAMYPGDSAFVENVKQEVKEQVERLQNHPCIALWCGNNEVNEGWHNWGWQKQYNYSKQDSTKIWDDYKNLFHTIIPNIIKEKGGCDYWASSPSIGWGHQESLLSGDSHYWGVWWGMEAFDVYEKKVGRFMSEYGFQGMPDLNTLKEVCDTLSLKSNSIKAHQKHPTGYQTINTYMQRDYKISADFRKYNYVSQLLQRDGITTAIEAHHRAMPYCMGTLYWQLNDCWPVTSWSAIDYKNRPKAIYYETKKLYDPVSISVKEDRKQHEIYIISDEQTNLTGTLEITIKKTNGEILYSKTKNVDVKNNTSLIYFSISEDYIKDFPKNEIYLNCVFKDTISNVSATKNYLFVKPKDLKLYAPELKMELNPDKKTVLISCKKFVKDLYLFSDNPLMQFKYNFIDIEPGEVVEIPVQSGFKYSTEIKYISLYDINN